MIVTRQPAHPDQLAREIGGQKKKWKGRLPVALLFPNYYRLGMSNLGFQLVHSIANQHPDIVCERVFFPESTAQPLSVESGRPLKDFPIILCSVSFEQDFLNLIKMLALGGIEPLAVNRKGLSVRRSQGDPLVIAGGVATFINPEPLSPFIDLFILGEAEPVLPQILNYLVNNVEAAGRDALLEEMGKGFDGCYVPRFYSVDYNGDGTLAAMVPQAGLPPRVKRISVPPLSAAAYSRILTPDTEFADLFLTELGRGCSRGCRFCAAGFVYRPPRLWSADAILSTLGKRPPETTRIGLLGMEMAQPNDLRKIAEYLIAESCSLSFSSLRADAFSPELTKLLKESGLKSAAIAPDGGSERLRRVINKGIVEQDVLQAAEVLVQAGINNLKLYFMIGLPTETQEDLDELVSLTLKVKAKMLAIGRARGRLSNLSLSVNSFVPKAWTPFQFHPFAPLKELKEKIQFLRKQLRSIPNVKITAERPVHSFFQAVLARGDRRVGKALSALLHTSGKWRQVFKDQGVQPEFYAMRQRGEKEPFPWEIVDHGIDRQYLWAEYQRALDGKSTPMCDIARCKRCGVCGE